MRTEQRESREALCPFCGRKLERPKELSLGPGEKAEGGACECGALYLADPTGKGVGEIMAQALNAAAEKLSKHMADLVPGEDYEEAVMRYDFKTHRSAGFDRSYADGYGRLYIIKVKKDVS